MRFGISNLIFNAVSNDGIDAILRNCAICDFAPTVHFGTWEDMPERLLKYPFKGHRTRISALQSLFYEVSNVSLVRDDASFERLSSHFCKVLNLASSNFTPSVIFGSPGVRSQIDRKFSHERILERVRLLADFSLSRNVKLCFEVNSPKFGCDFLTTNESLFDLYRDLDHPGLGLHLDVGQMIEEGLDPLEMVEIHKGKITHLHLSSPDL
ncbi:sugar phosphate isomerase/epimerase [Porticoccaceae bacterium]|nr:sugar phosphate isomerase/epimerase [Porticoccaceae bacterium]